MCSMEKSTCMILSQKGADEYNERKKIRKLNQKQLNQLNHKTKT